MVWHMARSATKEGYLRGMLCVKASVGYAGTGRVAQTLDIDKVTCKRCLAKLRIQTKRVCEQDHT